MSRGNTYVKDTHTDAQYEIPIRRKAVSAVDFTKIRATGTGTDRADQVAGGLRVHDLGSTAVAEQSDYSRDLERSLLLFGGHSLEQLSEIDLEDVLHRLVSGSYPTMPHMDGLSHKLTEAMLAVPDDVQRTVWTHPTSSPLPLIVAGISACLASHPDMITASHDANMFRKSPEDTDRVMIRTVAAYAVVSGLANSHRKGLRFTPPTRGRSYNEKSFVMAGLVDPRTGRPGRVKLSCFRQFDILNSDHGMAFTRVKQGRVKVFEYGHRSYKGINPRNLDLSADNPLKLAERLERGLYVNGDFSGNFVFTAINGFYPKIISMAMLAQRIMGIMTHWREYMCKQ
ncbi:putative citrate synthase [Aspergillus niger CBS 101883]|uniref:putative citrate synthase n=1 Tax=Aspergillus lacticoffeatus (strain CBS 101883) TaxID=1450533 RepID=UPI000D7EC3AF|nr:putative citrate synthase [Aspergillus niger CBS 101883]PYH61021.1 putative citrate synthase [Aspergillus niger CBS 101883]